MVVDHIGPMPLSLVGARELCWAAQYEWPPAGLFHELQMVIVHTRPTLVSAVTSMR